MVNHPMGFVLDGDLPFASWFAVDCLVLDADAPNDLTIQAKAKFRLHLIPPNDYVPDARKSVPEVCVDRDGLCRMEAPSQRFRRRPLYLVTRPETD
jgi:hypothetical protein